MTQAQSEFEQWAQRKNLKLDKSHDGTYVHHATFYAWLGWNAAVFQFGVGTEELSNG